MGEKIKIKRKNPAAQNINKEIIIRRKQQTNNMASKQVSKAGIADWQNGEISWENVARIIP